MTCRAPVEKLPLTVRKNIRDNFDANIPELQGRMAKLGFPDYTFVTNPNQLYAYAESGYAQINTGRCIYDYFEGFVRQAEWFTKDGRDMDAVESLKMVAPNNTAILVPDEENRYSDSGCDINKGQVRLLFNPDNLGYSSHDVARDLVKAVDLALEARGGDELPITVRRGIIQHLDEKTPALRAKLEKLFGKPFVLEADVARNFAFLRAHPTEFHDQTYAERVPLYTYLYFEAATRQLEYKGFGKDEMLREAFNDATEMGLIRFEIVERLQHGSCNDCVFEDGEFKLQTTAENFGVNIDNASDDIMDRL